MIKLQDGRFEPYSEQDILDNFPKEDFYVAFGSSHTAGWCDDGTERIMSREKNWPAQLEKKIGKPVFNLGMGGVMPQTMLEIVCDFLYYYKKQNAKCLGAFIEPRAHDFSLVQDKTLEFLERERKSFRDKDNPTRNEKAALMHHQAIALGRAYYTKNTLGNYYNVFNLGRQLSAGRHEKYDDIDNGVIKWIREVVYYQFMGAHVHFDCLNILLRMTQILGTHSIPNYTFYWECHEPEGETDEDTYNIQYLYYNTMAEYIKRGINYLKADNELRLHKRSFDIIKMVQDRTSKEFLDDNMCKCEHYNENVSAVVADILYEKVIK